MRCNRGANSRAVALHQVEHAGRHAGGVHHLGEDRGAARAFLGRFQHHRIAAGERRGHLQRDLVQRPVPRRDHADDADRFIDNRVGTDLLGKFEILQRFQRAHEAAETGRRLRGVAEADRRAHFDRQRRGDIGHALLIFLDDPAEQRQPLLARALAEGLERRLRGGDGGIDIGFGSEHDFGAGFLGRGIDDLVRRAADRIHPFAVDVILFVAVHGHLSVDLM